MYLGLLFDAQMKNGGSYQMSLNNLIRIKKEFEKINKNIIIFCHKNNSVLENLKIKYEIINLSFLDYIYILFINIFPLNYLIDKYSLKSSFEKKLIIKKVKILLFFKTSIKAFLLKKIKIVSTVLDVCHKDLPHFKEVAGIKFYYREFLNFKILPKSLFVITESKDLKNKISHLYKLNRNQIIPIPNVPSYLMTYKNCLNKFLKEEYITKVEKNYLKNKYNINFNYYFYPAQFWAHKNHIIILELLKKISKKKKINFIFSGKDKGCLKYIQNKISEYRLEKNIKILGYVSSEDILLLYKYANALVMPTYFGPTNIPPVEAWSLNVPVIYSSLLINHGKNAALYFHPNSINELENAIIKLETFNVREKLIVNGRNRLKNIIRENSLGQKLILKKINAEIL